MQGGIFEKNIFVWPASFTKKNPFLGANLFVNATKEKLKQMSCQKFFVVLSGGLSYCN